MRNVYCRNRYLRSGGGTALYVSAPRKRHDPAQVRFIFQTTGRWWAVKFKRQILPKPSAHVTDDCIPCLLHLVALQERMQRNLAHGDNGVHQSMKVCDLFSGTTEHGVQSIRIDWTWLASEKQEERKPHVPLWTWLLWSCTYKVVITWFTTLVPLINRREKGKKSYHT